MDQQVAILIPCFNEANRFPFEYWKDLVLENPQVQWMFIDDGSRDLTREILEEFCANIPAKLIKFDENEGKGNAIRKGMLAALNDYPRLNVIGFIDSDGAFSKKDINKFLSLVWKRLAVIEESDWDILISSRVALSGRAIERSMSRHYIGRIIATYLTRGWSGSPYDTQSGLKFFSVTPSLKSILEGKFETKWFVDIELISRLSTIYSLPLKIWEEPLVSWKEVEGSKVGFHQVIQIFIEMRFARKLVRAQFKVGKNQDGFN